MRMNFLCFLDTPFFRGYLLFSQLCRAMLSSSMQFCSHLSLFHLSRPTVIAYSFGAI